MSALLAKHGFTASPRGARGAARLRAGRFDQARLARDHRRARRALRDLVQHLQAVRLRHRDPSEHRRLRAAARRRACSAEQVERIELRVHSLVLELTGKKDAAGRPAGQVQRLPRLRGRADLRPRRRGRVLRRRSSTRPTSWRCAARCVATVDDGDRRGARRRHRGARRTAAACTCFVEHAIGSLRNPMTDAQLEAKFAALVEPVLGEAQGRARSRRLARRSASLADVRALTALCRP